jgi:23S rRNA (cytidine1920-2'-O)/16S rRNA (cytidine1409-2'-O)-methyltransferase
VISITYRSRGGLQSLREMRRVRLDSLLCERGLYPSRTRAAASVMAGEVLLLPERRRAQKPGQMVAPDVELELARSREYVSRGALKLRAALERFPIAVEGSRALDVGASTGGFTDLLLARGAAHVTALDVGRGELAWRLRQDPRVSVLEGANARHLRPEQLAYAPELITIDVSFISLSKVLPAVLGCAAARYDCLALVKPQFEAGRAAIGRGGVVREAAARRGALVAVAKAAGELGCSVLGFAYSGLPGPKGNRETFVWLGEHGRPAQLEDLQAAAAEVEP